MSSMPVQQWSSNHKPLLSNDRVNVKPCHIRWLSPPSQSSSRRKSSKCHGRWSRNTSLNNIHAPRTVSAKIKWSVFNSHHRQAVALAMHHHQHQLHAQCRHQRQHQHHALPIQVHFSQCRNLLNHADARDCTIEPICDRSMAMKWINQKWMIN